MSTTSMLPDLPWAVLLDPIMHDARPGDVMLVDSSDAMLADARRLVE